MLVGIDEHGKTAVTGMIGGASLQNKECIRGFGACLFRFWKPQPKHFPSGGLELPEALKEAQVNPPSGQGGLKISPLFPGHPANVFGSDVRLPPEFRPMPEPPGRHFIVRKSRGTI